MAYPALTDRELKRRVKAWRACGRNIGETARSLKVPRTTMQSSIDTARSRGFVPAKEYASARAVITRTVGETGENMTTLRREVATLTKQRDDAVATLERSRKAKAVTPSRLRVSRIEDFGTW